MYIRQIGALPSSLPYRIDLRHPPPEALDLLVELGALDLDVAKDGLAAILPDGVTPALVAARLPAAEIVVSDALARDDGSVWLLRARPLQIGRLRIVLPDEDKALPNALRLTDATAFGTGHHPTTALCVEALEELLSLEACESMLDVGTGSGILALAGLLLGVPQAVGLDIDPKALETAAENAKLNQLGDRLQLLLGGPETVQGTWPLVVANVLAAPLIDMAPVLAQKMGKRGRLLLSGIPASLEADVRHAYQRCGLRQFETRTRSGWTMILAHASW